MSSIPVGSHSDVVGGWPTENRARDRTDRALCFLLCVYLSTLVLEGPLRYGLLAVGAPNALYLRDVIALGTLGYLLARSVVVDRWLDPLLIWSAVIFGLHAAIALMRGLAVFQVLFGLKILMLVAYGMAMWRLVQPRFRSVLTVAAVAYAMTLFGVGLNFFLGKMPWEGLEYQNAFATVTTTREWSSQGLEMERIPGFARASYSAALILGITGALTMVWLVRRSHRAWLAVLTLLGIAATTTKGMLLAFVVVGAVLLIGPGRRGAPLRQRMVAVMCALTLVLPLLVLLLNLYGSAPDDLPLVLMSAWARFSYVWPEALELLPDGVAAVLGAGVGGIGTPQLYGHAPEQYVSPDNLVIFAVVTFGVLGVLYYLLPATAAPRVLERESDRVGESYAALVLLGYGYGIANNPVQDSFFAIALGCCLGAALLSLESTPEAAPAAQRR